MTVSEVLQEEAAGYARMYKGLASQLRNELEKPGYNVASTREKLAAALLVSPRLQNYQTKIGRYYQCPKCWMVDQVQATVKPFGNGTLTEEYFRCEVCHQQYSIPAP